jgi:prolyl-tRNA editing enzyme YbaK/EbsC (Cys-tRNA(Pro) deacylase)
MEYPVGVKQVMEGVKELGLCNESISIKQVESDYYEWSLEKRRDRLEAPSIAHLCKTLLFENSRQRFLQDQSDVFDKRHPKYVVVIIQYTDKMSTKKLNAIMREELFRITGIQQGTKYFNMRMASEETAIELTGYGNNEVSPVGMKKADSLRIVLSEKIAALDPCLLFLGAGHVDWKISLSTAEFIEKSKCMVKDISEI